MIKWKFSSDLSLWEVRGSFWYNFELKGGRDKLVDDMAKKYDSKIIEIYEKIKKNFEWYEKINN